MLFSSPEFARRALDAAPDALVITDSAGVIRFANQQLTALFGYAPEDVIGRSIEQLMPERFRTQHAGHRDGYFAAMRVRPMGVGLALFGRRRDGSEFPVEISLSPLHEGELQFVAAAVRDVTDRKRVEAELVVARASAEQARDSAERANQAKGRFLATASHDLRQPLQSLALLNGTLRRLVTDAEAATVLSHQEQAIHSMSRLLNALLDISKLESGAIKPEPGDFRVASVFEELRREFADLAANRGLDLQIEPTDASAHSDPALVGQILKNLLANAIKYTRQGGVRLRCQADGHALRIDVIDSGIGIAAEQLSHIFEEFYQVDAPANPSREGYGLGLSIVQRLVKLLDLRLNVASEPGKGSVFSVSLPPGTAAGRSVPERAPRPAVVERQRSRVRVLLVEDDPSVRDATRMLLRVEGYQVTAVTTLREALASARDGGAPDLLITDYHLRDGETGLQVIAGVRDSVGTAVKSVLVTGDTSTVIRELPGDEHLWVASKPINAEELLTLLRSLLSS